MRLEHTYTDTFPDLAQQTEPDIPASSRVTWVNEPLAQQLGLDPTWLASAEGLQWLTGTSPHGQQAQTFALAYSGFQFGNLSPLLGDGRAHLIGELVSDKPGEEGQTRVDLHLKGSGLTPFSRPGSDGKAPLAAVWREAVIGEFLAAMDIPTSRALAVIETGQKVRRRFPLPEPAGILVRVAASHLRVGTFQYAQMHLGEQERVELVDYALKRHYPEGFSREGELPALTLLRAVAERQADLLARWMGLGFIHGVLNTDNVAISGESIDFGPCAFMDGFSFDAVFSSIDQQGRYAFGKQPGITQWNLARYAETLLDLIDEDPNRAVELAGEVLADFEQQFQHRWVHVFGAKLGLKISGRSADERATISGFIGKTLKMLEKESIDFTRFFWTLAHEPADLEGLAGGNRSAVRDWLVELESLRASTGSAGEDVTLVMECANPLYIPRNLRLEAALRKVQEGNQKDVEELILALRTPFKPRLGFEDLAKAGSDSQYFRSFCGT